MHGIFSDFIGLPESIGKLTHKTHNASILLNLTLSRKQHLVMSVALAYIVYLSSFSLSFGEG